MVAGHFENIISIGEKVPRSPNPHILVVGTSGSGKSNFSEFLVSQYVGIWKVIELGDDDDWESLGYFFPENKPFLVQRTAALSLNQIVPHELQTKIIAIAGNGLEFYNQVPACIDICSIDPETLMLKDLEQIFNDRIVQNTLGHIMHEHENMNVLQLLTFLETDALLDKSIHTQTIWSLQRKIHSMFASGIFSDDYPRIDFKKILSNKQELTVFNTAFLENDEEKGLALSLILKNIYHQQRREKLPMLLYYRECADIFERDAPYEYRIAAHILRRIARRGRRMQFTLLLDTQYYKDIPRMMRANMGKKCYFNMMYEDAKSLIENENVPFEIAIKIARLMPGDFLLAHAGEFEYPTFAVPTPHLHKRKSLDFFEILGAKFGFVNVSYKMPVSRTRSSEKNFEPQINDVEKKKKKVNSEESKDEDEWLQN